MSTVGWIVVGVVVWIEAAVVVGVSVARIVRNADRATARPPTKPVAVPDPRPVWLRVSPDEECVWSGDGSNHMPGGGRDREECRFCDGWMGGLR